MREKTYQQAIKEALRELMLDDQRVILLGQGLDSPWSFGDTTLGLNKDFGGGRVHDIPISENGMTGVAVGAAMTGLRPIIMHPRVDFMYLAMDQIINHAANWYYMFGGRVNVPVVVRGVVNRGNEQAAQHSQSPHGMFAHVPGLKVVMPSSPADAKGLMIAAVRDPNPVVYIDDRWLYPMSGHVPEGLYQIPIGKGVVRREGRDLTVVALSYALKHADAAARSLSKEGIEIELIDPRTIKPLDADLILRSVRKTGRLLVVDSGWLSFGFSGEVVAAVTERAFSELKAAPMRIASPDTPVPASVTLEEGFYINENSIITAARRVLDVGMPRRFSRPRPVAAT